VNSSYLNEVAEEAPAGAPNGKPRPPVPFVLVTQPTADAEPTTDPAAEPGTRGAVPTGAKTVQYKGAALEAERGPGLGCFRFQLVVLVVLLILTPIGVNAGWPDWLTAALLIVTLALLLVAGQTVIFLLRLIAADRRSRRRPLASQTRTVGELADAAVADAAVADAAVADAARAGDTLADAPSEDGRDGDRSVRQ
jgi:hypothetical protein